MAIPVGFKTSLVATPTGSTIAVHESGTTGPCVFVVGGMSGAPVADTPLGEVLAAAPVRCTMIDIPTSGESRHEGVLTMDVIVEDIRHVFAERVGRAAIWVGSSLGAWLAILVHRGNPEWFSGICALGPAFDWDSQFVQPAFDMGWISRQDGQIVGAGGVFVPESLVDSMPAHHVLDAFNELAVPIHVIFGGKDAIAPPIGVKRFLESVKGARFTADFFPDGEHRIAKLATPVSRERFESWLGKVLAG